MLQGINPILTGDLLKWLDEMGHSDSVVIADAHFPAARLATRLVRLPTVAAPDVVAAIRSVLPLDDSPAMDIIRTADGSVLPVQRELMAAAGVEEGDIRFIDRFDFYDVTESAFLVVLAGETRTYACSVLRKGIVSG